ncbi:conserved hypothetical protein [Lodderomyces elongisporus NRRL YB-4239]|uniref:Uncharacterized protein n=1 Tax=Lodderomyces elongisporus (strain ATCC 11503 / CBS 2605 / JCM 1781 / NBRC 1676 / NRRL YB-4239) TaxID=379508 RepID=A5DYF8_LODEL|nr:conserved hypothetical protein [Lodderomyces elongisporus NRRL YB-4239]
MTAVLDPNADSTLPTHDLPNPNQNKVILPSSLTSTSITPTIEPQIPLNLVPPLNFSLVEDGIYRCGFPMPINYPFLQQLNFKTIIYLGDLGHEPTEPKKEKDKRKGNEKEEPKEKKKKKEKEKDKKKKKKDKDGSVEILNQYVDWIKDQGSITFHNLLVESLKEPFNKMEEHEQTLRSLTTALTLILDRSNYPILIHSNKGKHRTGLLVGLMRKLLQGWCLSGIFEEYEKFALGKFEYDLELIEIWQPELWVNDDNKPNFVRI